MGISFSGLTSGLDTSSWVQSLTALKRAKVTTLESKKKTLTSSLDALYNIKTFFNSFRSTLERVTDAKFNVASIDLFSQKLAMSSNPSVVTANVTPKAETGTYDIKVDKIATNTKATSNYKTYETVVEKKEVTEYTKLADLGVSAGNISLTGLGATRLDSPIIGGELPGSGSVQLEHNDLSIYISSSETIKSFINKLESVGVDAAFNAKTGIFSMGCSAHIIDDIDNTNICEALHLGIPKTAYSSEKLQIRVSGGSDVIASDSTKLSEFGVNEGTLSISNSSGLYQIDIGENTTFGTLIGRLRENYGVDAALYNGHFVINNAVITSDGTTNFIEALGLTETTASTIMTSGGLSYEKVSLADSNTTFGMLGAEEGDSLKVSVYKNGARVDTLTFGVENTIGQFLWNINNGGYGLNAELDPDSGVITVQGDGYITLSSKLQSILGIGVNTYTGTITADSISGDTVTYTKLADATGATTLGELGLTSAGLRVLRVDRRGDNVRYDSDGHDRKTTEGYSVIDDNHIYKIITFDENSTLNDLMDFIGSNGGTATLANGVISVASASPDTELFTLDGQIAAALGFRSIDNPMVVQNSMQSSSALSYTITTTATGTTELKDLVGGAERASYLLVIKAGNTAASIYTFQQSATLDTVVSRMNTYGLGASLTTDGQITFTGSDTAHYIDSSCTLANLLGISTRNYTHGASITSSAPVRYTTYGTARVGDTWASTRYNFDSTITASSSFASLGDVVAIESVAGLKRLMTLVANNNSMSGKTFVLMSDLDLSSETRWYNNSDKPFEGTFDGAGHTISNMKQSNQNNSGLFGIINNATVKNIVFSGVSISQSNATARYAGVAAALMSGNSTVAGISVTNADMSLSCFTGNITGGIVGCTKEDNGTKVISNCSFRGNITLTSEGTVGGIVGAARSGLTVENCFSAADITSTANAYAAIGGIVGDVRSDSVITSTTQTINIKDCLFSDRGIIKSSSSGVAAYQFVSGIVGKVAAYDDRYMNRLKLNMEHCIVESQHISVASINAHASSLFNVKDETSGNHADAITASNCLSLADSIDLFYKDPATTASVQTPGSSKKPLITDAILNSYGFDTSIWFNAGTLQLAVANDYQFIYKAKGAYVNGESKFYTLDLKGSDIIQALVTLSAKDGPITANAGTLQFHSGKLSANMLTGASVAGVNTTIHNYVKDYTTIESYHDTKMTDDTTLVDLLGLGQPGETTFPSGESRESYNITIVQNGTSTVLTIDTVISESAGSHVFYGFATVGDVIDKLASVGITASVSNDGKLMIGASETVYISGMDNALKNVFKFSSATNASGGITNTDSNTLQAVGTLAADEDTTLGELGYSSTPIIGQTVDLFTFSDGTKFSVQKVYVENLTVGNIISALALKGINATYDETEGKLRIESPDDAVAYLNPGKQIYITSIESNLANILKLGSDYTRRVKIQTGNTPSNRLQSSRLYTMSTSSTFAELYRSSGCNVFPAGTSDGDIFGVITFVNNLNETSSVTIRGDETIGAFSYKLYTSLGITGTQVRDGSISIDCTGTNYKIKSMDEVFSTVFKINSGSLGGTSIATYNTPSKTLTHTTTEVANDNTKLSDLGVTVGKYYVYQNGTNHEENISENDTIGSFLGKLYNKYGITGGLTVVGDQKYLSINCPGDIHIASASGADASNIMDLFTNQISYYRYEADLIKEAPEDTFIDATKETKLSDLDIPWGDTTLKAAGDLSITIDGVDYMVNISSDDTISSFMESLRNIGLEAELFNNKLRIFSKNKEFSLNSSGSTSSIIPNLGLRSDKSELAVSNELEVETSTTVEKYISAAAYADNNLQLKFLNITSGTFSIFKDGSKQVFELDENMTFAQLHNKVHAKFSDVTVGFEDGHLRIYSSTEGVDISVGASNDTSNIQSLCGFQSDGNGGVSSFREFYKVNGESKIMNNGLFKLGNVSAGNFTIGLATFTIDSNTTINSLIRQINASDKSGATAYWDSVTGNFVIKSRTSGASLINISKGTSANQGDHPSNFAQILGFTLDDETKISGGTYGKATLDRLNVAAQEKGENAKFSINGTEYVTSSNTVGSDVTKITGVTFNLNNISNGNTVTISIEQDEQSLSNAVEDIVDAYNELLENVDKELSAEGELKDQSPLKLIRNQIRSLMTNPVSTSGVFKNLSSIGIGLDAASAGNISTSRIDTLNFDKEKFAQAYKTDCEGVRELLVGNDGALGVFSKVENVLESALKSATGYFSTTEKSYKSRISSYNTKIEKQNLAVERYTANIESKFKSMEMMISKIQEQYSSFLGT